MMPYRPRPRPSPLSYTDTTSRTPTFALIAVGTSVTAVVPAVMQASERADVGYHARQVTNRTTIGELLLPESYGA
jgi:hypothetical protein